MPLATRARLTEEEGPGSYARFVSGRGTDNANPAGAGLSLCRVLGRLMLASRRPTLGVAGSVTVTPTEITPHGELLLEAMLRCYAEMEDPTRPFDPVRFASTTYP